MLVDKVTVNVKAGNGGNGAISFKRNAQTAKGGPDGGNGGKGGDIYIQGIDDVLALSQFRYKKNLKAEDGIKGGKFNLYGRNGKDSVIYVPVGTQVTDLKKGNSFEIDNNKTKILLAKGGKGGRGNNEFKSATNQTPRFSEKGEVGEEKIILLELKIIADLGIIGLPNSGKSSLLSVLTNAHPKIGDYPFTTLEPNLGVFGGLVIADIPGLIEGASKGKGLGDKFLKHIEKTKILIHCIDIQSETIVEDYKVVRKELIDYSEKLKEKSEILVLTKSDLVNSRTLREKLKEASKLSSRVLSVSIYDEKALDKLRDEIKKSF